MKVAALLEISPAGFGKKWQGKKEKLLHKKNKGA
jgi:hypothetical protein